MALEDPAAATASEIARCHWRGETSSIGNRQSWCIAEQGSGDSLQFCRYVPMLARLAKVDAGRAATAGAAAGAFARNSTRVVSAMTAAAVRRLGADA